MSLRIWSPVPLAAGLELSLEPGAARHVQVRRLQPGDALQMFDGSAGQWHARVLQMTRNSVSVCVDHFEALSRELPFHITLGVGMPANERMDWLVEKATELGVAAVAPLICERSVLRVANERAQRKQEHWQAVAQAATEQCGRTRMPQVLDVQTLSAWLKTAAASGAQCLVLSTQPQAQPLHATWQPGQAACLLSGPEGGLTEDEQAQAVRAGFTPVSLGPRILRAETAPLAALAHFGLATP
jgi:16S rRNA (uracil1498-N3)-methyltransferase